MINKNNLNRLDLEILGDILFLSLHSDTYKDISVENLYNKFIEIIKVGDFQVVRDKEDGLPIAFTCWSFVSDDVLKDMLENDRDLKKEEMNSGNNLLFLELFTPNKYYWDFFDHLTNYFNNEYEGKYSVDKSKIYTCCGLHIGFNNGQVEIKKVDA